MTNPGTRVETEPVAPGDQLLSMYGRLWTLRRDMDHADWAMDRVSPIKKLRVLRQEHEATGFHSGEPARNQLAEVGRSALRTLSAYDIAEERHSAAKEESARLEEELLERAGDLIGVRMDIEALAEESGAIIWDRQGWGRSREVSHASGIIIARPPNFVLENQLQLSPVEAFRKMIGGTYHIRPLDDGGQPQVAINIRGV